MQAKIMKFKVSHSMRKALFVKNGSINDTYGIQVNKTLSLEDAKRLEEILSREG